MTSGHGAYTARSGSPNTPAATPAAIVRASESERDMPAHMQWAGRGSPGQKKEDRRKKNESESRFMQHDSVIGLAIPASRAYPCALISPSECPSCGVWLYPALKSGGCTWIATPESSSA